MSRINPYFEVNGNRYELKRTRWLFAEYRRLNEENPLSEEDRENAVKASNLVADVKRYAEKEKECWDKLCEEPTPDNQRIYMMFKEMSDKAVVAYNSFVNSHDTLTKASKRNIDILEQVAIKAIAEQYYSGNEQLAKQTWEAHVEAMGDHNKVAEWLNAMSECLFGSDDDEGEEDSFLSKVKKDKENKEFLRKQAARKKR